jgi:hypothetical protein
LAIDSPPSRWSGSSINRDTPPDPGNHLELARGLSSACLPLRESRARPATSRRSCRFVHDPIIALSNVIPFSRDFVRRKRNCRG